MLLMAERGGGAAAAGAGGIITVIAASLVAIFGGGTDEADNRPANAPTPPPISVTDPQATGPAPVVEPDPPPVGPDVAAPKPLHNYAELSGALADILEPDNGIEATPERLGFIFQAPRFDLDRLGRPDAEHDLRQFVRQLDLLYDDCIRTGSPMDQVGEFPTALGTLKIVRHRDGGLRIDPR